MTDEPGAATAAGFRHAGRVDAPVLDEHKLTMKWLGGAYFIFAYVPGGDDDEHQLVGAVT
jgi:hypothetical protein